MSAAAYAKRAAWQSSLHKVTVELHNANIGPVTRDVGSIPPGEAQSFYRYRVRGHLNQVRGRKPRRSKTA